MNDGPTENRLGELGSLYKYYYYYMLLLHRLCNFFSRFTWNLYIHYVIFIIWAYALIRIGQGL